MTEMKLQEVMAQYGTIIANILSTGQPLGEDERLEVAEAARFIIDHLDELEQKTPEETQ